MPTPSWTVSFTMPTASNSSAKACAGHAANRTRRLDQPPSPVTQIHRPARLATRAASFRYGGRHHSGIPGDIIPLYPGDFVGIRRLNGSKHLVPGNHDNPDTLSLPWASVGQIRQIVVDGQKLVLCHYALRTWPASRRGAIHLYGHSHGTLPGNSQSTDVGVDCWSYRPVTLVEIKEVLERNPPTGMVP